MTELKELKRLKDEEKSLMNIASKLSDQLNRLKVEELALLSMLHKEGLPVNTMEDTDVGTGEQQSDSQVQILDTLYMCSLLESLSTVIRPNEVSNIDCIYLYFNLKPSSSQEVVERRVELVPLDLHVKNNQEDEEFEEEEEEEEDDDLNMMMSHFNDGWFYSDVISDEQFPHIVAFIRLLFILTSK